MSWEDVGRALVGVVVVLVPTFWWISRNVMSRKEIQMELRAVNGRLDKFYQELTEIGKAVEYIRGKLEGNNG